MHLFFLLFISFTIFTNAHASMFMPYEYLESQIKNRRDLQLNLQINIDPEKTNTTKLRITDVQLDFLSAIANLLDNTERTQNDFDSEAFSISEPSCLKHYSNEAKNQLIALVKESIECYPLREEITKTLQQANNSCLSIDTPERFVLNHSATEFKESDLDSIEGLIQLAGRPLAMYTKFPSAILNKNFAQQLRTILKKIRQTPIQAEQQSALTAYNKLFSLFANNQICLVNFAKAETIINELKTEINENIVSLSQVMQMGAEEARQNRLNLMREEGRCRADLPIPSLTDDERQFLSKYLGGIYWRMRGGGLWKASGTREARRLFNLKPMIQLGILNGGTAIGTQMGEAINNRISKGWGEYMDMGGTPGGGDKYYDLMKMTERGQYQIDEAKDVLQNAGYNAEALEVGGLGMGPCYYFAIHAPLRFSSEALPPPFGSLIDGGTAWGELCTGASISLGMSQSLLRGKNCTDDEKKRNLYKTEFHDCESSDYKEQRCDIGKKLYDIELEKQYSKSSGFWNPKGECIKDKSFKIDGNSIVVTNGCRAKFKVYID